MPRRFLGVNRMIDVPIILSAVYPKMRSALGFGKAEKANRSLQNRLVQNKVRAKNQSPPTMSKRNNRTAVTEDGAL